jgi:small subunit ribosomal protein S6
LAQIYEGMFLLDNEVVRADWRAAKAVALDTLNKNGATVQTARRWDERKLAYPIGGKQRATYLLCYYEIPADNIPTLIRDLDLSEPILRYILTRAAAVPAEERELADAEDAKDFEVPAPPSDDVGTYSPVQGEAAEEASEETAEGEKPAEKTEEKTEEKAEGVPAADDKPEPVAVAAEADAPAAPEKEEG